MMSVNYEYLNDNCLLLLINVRSTDATNADILTVTDQPEYSSTWSSRTSAGTTESSTTWKIGMLYHADYYAQEATISGRK